MVISDLDEFNPTGKTPTEIAVWCTLAEYECGSKRTYDIAFTNILPAAISAMMPKPVFSPAPSRRKSKGYVQCLEAGGATSSTKEEEVTILKAKGERLVSRDASIYLSCACEMLGLTSQAAREHSMPLQHRFQPRLA